jgi:hypothetical protein
MSFMPGQADTVREETEEVGMTERRGGGPLLSRSTTQFRKNQQVSVRNGGGRRAAGRGPAALALTLGLLLATGTAQSATASTFGPEETAATPHLALPAGNTPTGGHDHGGGSNATPTPGTSPSPGAEHNADSHVDLPEGGQEWTLPNLVAEGALVRVETVADVYVALHHYHVENYPYRGISDPEAVASGSFVNARGLVVTSKGALHDDAEQERRFGTYGVNRAFVQAGFLKQLPKDPFSRTTITSRNKGPLADSPPTNPLINDRLQSCYNWETSHHCAVFVVMHQRIVPSVQDPKTRNLEGLPLSDTRVAAVSTQPRGVTPLTLQLANPEPGTKYWVVSSRGVNEKPLVGTGTLTDSEQDPISDADLAKWSKQFGVLAEGSPVISARGDLVAFLGTAAGSGRLGAVSSSHIANDLRTFGLTRDSSPIDAQFQDGLQLFEASQFAAAVPKLKAAVTATGGQRVARQLLAQSEQKSGTAEDLSDEADLLSVPNQKSDGWSTLAIALFSALVILVLIGVGIAIAMARRRSWPDGEDDEAEPADGPGQGNNPGAGQSGGPDSGAGVSHSGADAATGLGAGLDPRTAERARTPVAAANAGDVWTHANGLAGAGSPPAPGAPNGHPSRPTALFATGTTNPKPAAPQARRAVPATDRGEAPTEKRAAAPMGGAEAKAVSPSAPALGPVGERGRAAEPSQPPAPSRAAEPGLPPAPSQAGEPGQPSSGRSAERGHPEAADRAASTDPGLPPGGPRVGSGHAPVSGQTSIAGQPVSPARPAAPQRPSGGFCRQCGSQLSPGDRFCFSCGTPASSPAGKG